MMSAISSRREFSFRVASACSLVGLSGLPFLISSASAFAAETEEISRYSEAIHEGVEFKAPPDRVYKALTDSTQFGKITVARCDACQAQRPRADRTRRLQHIVLADRPHQVS